MRNVKHVQGDKGGNIETKFVINKISCRKHNKYCKYENYKFYLSLPPVWIEIEIELL